MPRFWIPNIPKHTIGGNPVNMQRIVFQLIKFEPNYSYIHDEHCAPSADSMAEAVLAAWLWPWGKAQASDRAGTTRHHVQSSYTMSDRAAQISGQAMTHDLLFLLHSLTLFGTSAGVPIVLQKCARAVRRGMYRGSCHCQHQRTSNTMLVQSRPQRKRH